MTNHLFMIMLGATPKGRHIEQHDIYFGIGNEIKDLIPQVAAFWSEAGPKLHIDAWKEVNTVQNYKIEVVNREDYVSNDLKLFFINLGGYKPGIFDEFHQTCLVVANSQKDAIQYVKSTAFYEEYNLPPRGYSHVDNKYGLDVDDIYEIDEILNEDFRRQYAIAITPSTESLIEDHIELGYMKLSSF
ncbi:DUF1543 domain-containing protein [Myroides sp. M-43]|uniref:DUF1543 domain-containing protein n=1 Tax=Myroides oncorhynchi TaxID=2893756 RepID=UPI001E352091|nr:DUF1543 domain-containing protein [Myroides oncorhynchi]MCC9042727.1 DUF1543 domain-containing protein [Myroides oncorhynchi]